MKTSILKKQKFNDYRNDHVDIESAELETANGNLYLFVAIGVLS